MNASLVDFQLIQKPTVAVDPDGTLLFAYWLSFYTIGEQRTAIKYIESLHQAQVLRPPKNFDGRASNLWTTPGSSISGLSRGDRLSQRQLQQEQKVVSKPLKTVGSLAHLASWTQQGHSREGVHVSLDSIPNNVTMSDRLGDFLKAIASIGYKAGLAIAAVRVSPAQFNVRVAAVQRGMSAGANGALLSTCG